MASPFFTDVVKVVGSFDTPHGVVSDDRGSTMKVLEIRLGSASAAAVSVGAPGGAPPAPGVPQLKSPPVPVTLTAPAGQVGTGDAEPELAQSNVTPAGGVRRTLPSSASQFEGAALDGRGISSAAVALTANASNAAERRRRGRTVSGTVPELTHRFNRALTPILPQPCSGVPSAADWVAAGPLAAVLLRSANRCGVDVELVEPPIRVVPSAVRIVSPGRMRDPAVEREARVITIVDVVTRVMRVRRSRADLNVLGECLSAVRAEGSPELRVIIRHAIDVSGSTGSQIASRVVPDDRDLPSGLIE